MNVRDRMRDLTTTHVLVALLVVAAACDATEDVPEPGPPPTQAASPTADATPSPTGTVPAHPCQAVQVPEEGVEVWFHQGEKLFVVHRDVPPEPQAAIEALLGGPAAVERLANTGSQIPTGTRLLGVSESTDGNVTIDLSVEYESGGGSLSMTMRLAQVVFTLTQFPEARTVSFEIEGRPVETFSGEGIVLDEPSRRKDFEDVLPPVLVLRPGLCERVPSPIHVEGTANVFEATVSLRLLDATGHRLAKTFTTATCGTGCRGTYEADLEYEVDHEQVGTLEVYWSSPEDGQPKDVVSIPVVLVP